jgi:hypothetical protein
MLASGAPNLCYAEILQVSIEKMNKNDTSG